MDPGKQNSGDRWIFFCCIKAGIKPEELADINKLQNLQHLNLAFNALDSLPESFFELRNLKYLDLRYNKFSKEVDERISNAFPETEIVWK